MGLSAAPWIAIGAACAAAVALSVAVYLFAQIRRLRANQIVLLGGGKDDLVDFAVSLQARMDDLHGAVFAPSPLVRRQSTVTAGFGISWIFATSSQRVLTDD